MSPSRMVGFIEPVGTKLISAMADLKGRTTAATARNGRSQARQIRCNAAFVFMGGRLDTDSGLSFSALSRNGFWPILDMRQVSPLNRRHALGLPVMRRLV